MLFSVIYDFDCHMDRSVKTLLPPNRKLWQMTERSDGQPSEYCSDLWDGKVKHRKLCAILSREQFKDFVHHIGLFAEDVETMGSLGAPGFGYGCAPAISFRADEYDAIVLAYVTPFPNWEPSHRREDKDWQERCWNRIRCAVITTFS